MCEVEYNKKLKFKFGVIKMSKKNILQIFVEKQKKFNGILIKHTLEQLGVNYQNYRKTLIKLTTDQLENGLVEKIKKMGSQK